MNRPLTGDEIAVLEVQHPVTEPEVKKPLTKAEKLIRLAELVEKHPCSIFLFDRLEHQSDYWKSSVQIFQCRGTFLGIAAQDPVFHSLGLTEHATLLDAQRLLELRNEELHEVSCNCGGQINQQEMGRRLRAIAGRSV